MRAVRFTFLILFAAIAIFASAAVHAQKPCPRAPIPGIGPDENMFSIAQEVYLGDAIAERTQRENLVIDDPAMTAYLQRVGDRLVRHVSADSMKFQFVLFDLPEAQAFGTAGGRIYVSRKLVSFMRSEDELAGLLGHEIGHLVAHQTAMTWTLLFKRMIGVNSVSDRRDIFDKYQQFYDNVAKKPEVWRAIAKEEEPHQIIADRLGLFASSASGYDPRALVQFWDRFAETKGKTGSFFSDLFGSTKPEQRRLRELEAEMSSLPGSCGDPRPAASADEFAAWRTAVMNYTGLGHKESLHGIVLKQELNPPLRGDIHFLRFSPDGKYAMAQDDSSIYVLTRDPFAYVFRIDAPDAHPALFSADSHSLSFYTRGLRVETWSLADQQRTELHDLVVQHECVQSALSSDGKYLACAEMLRSFRYNPTTLTVNGTIDLHLYNVATGESVFEKKDFSQPFVGILGRPLLIYESEDVRTRATTLRFSPDSHYFLAASHNDESLALELPSLKPVSVARSLKKYLNHEFMFVTPDQLIGVGEGSLNNSALLRFPSGDVVEELTLGLQNVEAAAYGKFILLRPIDKYALGVMDLETKKVFMADANSAFDIYDSVALVTHANGEIGLKQVATKQDTASLLLPRGPLAPLRAQALSSDLKFLAISERSRGAVWDLTKNERPFYVRGFVGAYFNADGTLYADFPKERETERMVGQLNMNSHSQSPAYKVAETNVEQIGQFLLLRKLNGKDQNIRENITLEVRDSTSNTTLWTRAIPNDAPTIKFSSNFGSVALTWRLSGASAANELKTNPDLAKRAESVPKDDMNFLIEILDAHTGKMGGALVLDTNKGSFAPDSVFAVGDRVVVSDFSNRVQVYSIATGRQIGKTFGRAPQVSVPAGILAAINEGGQIVLYDLATMEKRDELQFTSRIAMYQFSDDGKRLFVLTAGQTAYLFDVAALSKSAAVASGGQ